MVPGDTLGGWSPVELLAGAGPIRAGPGRLAIGAGGTPTAVGRPALAAGAGGVTASEGATGGLASTLTLPLPLLPAMAGVPDGGVTTMAKASAGRSAVSIVAKTVLAATTRSRAASRRAPERRRFSAACRRPKVKRQQCGTGRDKRTARGGVQGMWFTKPRSQVVLIGGKACAQTVYPGTSVRGAGPHPKGAIGG